MKYKIIFIGLFLFTLPFSNPTVFAQYPAEGALEKTAREIYSRIMCPICAGQTIAQSNSGTSTQMRNLVLKKLRQGETKEEILQYFVSKYGERIMAKPNKKGFNLMLWFLPFVSVVLVAVGIYFLIRRWSTKVQMETVSFSDETHLAEYKERVERELKEFEV
ncbi:MAG TPA: cytochrome c-type biogenesis protein CcmH [Desulfobacterales bacterium]|nr:cytochrome c-type biogenesis protein CcmH [Desulfobacterales bacterium]